MRNVCSKIFLVLLCASFLCASAEGQKKRVAVLDFEFGTVERWWDWNWDVGKGVAELMVDRMVNDGTFSVI